MPFETPTVHVREPSVIAASFRDLFFVVWLGQSNIDILRSVLAHERALVRRLLGRKMAVLTVLESSTIRLPDAATREMVDTGRRELAPHTKAEAVVLPKSGFAAATIRGMIAGIMLLQRPPFPAIVLDGLDEAFSWMAPRLDPVEGRLLSGAVLAEAYQSLDVPAVR